jgi:hypothetical protein
MRYSAEESLLAGYFYSIMFGKNEERVRYVLRYAKPGQVHYPAAKFRLRYNKDFSILRSSKREFLSTQHKKTIFI